MLRLRVLTAIVGIPVLMALIYFGGLPLFFATLAVMLLALDELFRAIGKQKATFGKGLGYLGGIIFVTGSFFFGDEMVLVVFLVAVINLAYFVWMFPKIDFSGIGVSFLSSVYVGFLLGFLLLLRGLPQGRWCLLLAFLLTWSADTGGYAIGTLFGKHKLHASLSPKKTWEGFLGGVVVAGLVGFVLAGLFSAAGGAQDFVVLGLLSGVAAQVGDLAASAIKRQADIKDFSNVLPGHGGWMDRIDSFLLVAPLVYYYLRLFIID